jgi:hypothetical protein
VENKKKTSFRRLEVANLIIRFGKHELLDFGAEIVIPALLDDSLERRLVDSVILFCDCGLSEVAVGSTTFNVVYGRIVRDTVVKREQVFDRATRRVIRKRGRMDSAPSAVFALILENHKLVYISETAKAPTLSMFEATLKDFVVRKHREFSKSLRGKGAPEYPSVELVPLASEQSLAEFVSHFDLISRINIQLYTPNSEIDNDEFFAQAREHRQRLKAKTTNIVHQNTQGLDKKAAVKELKDAAAEGNTKIVLSGKDSAGDRLTGDNSKFKATAQIQVPENATPAEQAAAGVQKASDMADSKIIKPASWLTNATDKAKSVVACFRASRS